MMKRSEFDLHKELKAKPFKHHGFTESLRRRIEDQLDGEKHTDGSKKWVPFAIGLCIAVCMILIVNPPLSVHTPEQTVRTTDDVETSLPFNDEEELVLSTVPLRSALLIGFRTDASNNSSLADQRNEVSQYRTLLIAPDQDRLAVAAEGNTLLVPYGQTFWSFAPSYHDSLPLSLHPAAEGERQADSSNSAMSPLQLEQMRILYAGNRYVSIEQARQDVGQGKDGYRTEYRVYNYTDLLLTDQRTSVPHVDLASILEPDTEYADSQWYMDRAAGQWRAIVPDSQQPSRHTLPDGVPVATELPQEVVSHDQLTITWDNIRSRQREARDALESPTGELLAVLTDSRLYFYTIHEGELSAAPLLSIAIDEDEALVMAQWAIDQYVPVWKDQVSRLLKDEQP